jgi:nucleoside-diphosphate-sugar epimerase
LAEIMWKKVHGPESTLRYACDEPFAHDVQLRVPSVEKAKKILGFEATTPLEEVLDEVVPWIRNAMASGLI